MLWTVAWLLGSAIFGYFYAGQMAPGSIVGYIAIAVVALFVTPFLFLIAVMAIGIPLFVVGNAFRSSFTEKPASAHVGALGILRDLTSRVVLLGIAIFLLVKAFQVGIESELPYLILLAAVGSLSGELAAMLVYLFRRGRVVETTNALLRVDPPVGGVVSGAG